ncbi:MAG: bifunctional homocysteine S-methyltransferase/methylenetetrahydrofolate reductase [Anaerolineaceae bacterium]
MKPYRFNQLLEGVRPILSDGAMGTMLNQRNISFEECFDNLNIEKPAMVAEVHREYIEAGSQIIQTNTYGANRYKLARFGLEDKVADINRAGVELARRVILASFSDVLVAGDVGPLGVRLAPFGRVLPEQAFEVFKEQIAALLEAGVDLLIIETITDLYEIREAIHACRTLNTDIPIIASMTYTRDDRTLLGDSPAKVARKLKEDGADILGVNCSGGPSQILRVLKQMHQAVPDGKFSAMPNAGWPEHMSGRIMYPASPDYFSDYALAFWEAGAKVIGGCCGTTPQHIAVMHEAIQSAELADYHNGLTQTVVEEEETAPALQPTQLAVKLARKEFVITVEMDPPRGLTTNKLLAGASLLAEAGADVINVADSPMASMRMSPWAVCSLIQKQVGIETVLHFPTRGRNLLRVQGDLLAAHAMGVRNVFVVMGDPTAIGDYPDAMDNYDLVPSGLIKLIKQRFNAGIDHAGADIGQPTTFFVGCALNLTPSNFDDEIKNLNRKIRAGADFCLTQPIYDPHALEVFLDRYHRTSGDLSIPLIVGILPLVNYRHAEFLHHEVPGIAIPVEIRDRMQKAGEDSPKAGIQIAVELIEKIKPRINGIYLMPAFSRFDYVAEIIESVSKG